MTDDRTAYIRAWRRYKLDWARSILGAHATSYDLDSDRKRLARRAFRAGWRAMARATETR